MQKGCGYKKICISSPKTAAVHTKASMTKYALDICLFVPHWHGQWSVSRGCDVTRAPMDPDSVIRVQTWDRVFDLTFSLATALWDTGQPRAGQLAAMAWSWAPWWSSNIGDKRCLKPSEYQIVHCIVSADLDSPASNGTRRFHPLGWLNYLLTS